MNIGKGRLSLAGLIGALVLTASGCFSGGESDGSGSNTPPLPPPPPPAFVGGLWTGALWWDPRNGFPGGAQNVRLLLAETGEFRMMLFPDVDNYFATGSEQVFGNFNIDGGDISTAGDGVWLAPVNATGDDWAAFGLAGDFLAGESISGTFQANFAGWTHNEERVGTFSLNYHSLYEDPSSLDILQGIYATTDESLAVDAEGVIFYQSSVTGCTGNGTAEIIDPAYNMYRMTIYIDACTGDSAVRNGLTFTGLANIGHNNDPTGAFLNATLEMAVSAPRALPFGSGYVPWSLLADKH